MDLWQIGRQIPALLAAATWEDAPSDVVLTGGAVHAEDLDGNFLPPPQAFLPAGGPDTQTLPFARVQHLGSTSDPSSPARFDRSLWRVWVVAGGGGITGATQPVDDHGEAALKGYARAATQPQGKTTGRSLDEILARLIEAAFPGGRAIDSTHGLQATVGGPGPALPVDGVQVVARSFTLEVSSAAVARRYHEARRFKASASAGTVTLTWSKPPARFDTVDQAVIRRASGSTAPSSPTSGTGVTVAAGATTATDAPGSGTWSYSIFYGYDESSGLTGGSPTTPDRYSPAVSFTGLAV